MQSQQQHQRQAEVTEPRELHPSSSSPLQRSTVFSFKQAAGDAAAAPTALAAPSTSAATTAGSTIPSSPGTPSSPAGLTHLRKLPFPNRLLQALPEYLNIPTSSHACTPSSADSSAQSSSGLGLSAASSHASSGGGSGSSSSQPAHSGRPPVHRWLRLPLAVLTHMTPASAFTDPLSDVVGDADKASAVHDQTLVERIQQEKMRQEAQAALGASHDLAQGQSTLLGNASGGGYCTTPAAIAAARSARRLSTPMLATSVRSQRSMSLPHALPPLTLQHATLTTVLAAAQPSAKRKVTFSSLLHKLPHPSLKKLSYHRRTASFSHSESDPVTAAVKSPQQHSALSTTPRVSPTSLTKAAAPQSLSARVFHAPSRLVRSVVRRTGHMFREAVFMLHLAAILLSQLGLFGRWAFMAFRLFLFAGVLCMAWAKIGYCVLMDVRTAKGLQYGPFNRNFLDIYLPTKVKGSILTPHTLIPSADDPAFRVKHPVFIYVTGGAWIIGYKAWGALLGLLMRSQQCVVVSVDYRNFPQGNIEDMVVDIEQALRWIWDNIDGYGGDRNAMFLAGQSAGAHITSILLLRNAKREAEGMFDDELRAEESEESSEQEQDRIKQTQQVVEEAQEIVDIAREHVQLEDQQLEQMQQQQSEGCDSASKALHNGEQKESSRNTPLSIKSSNGTEMSKHRPPPLDPATTSSATASSTASSAASPTASPSPSPTPPSPSTLLAVSSALRTGFPVSRFRGYIGISGIYELSRRVIDHLHASGLPGGTVIAIMGGMKHINAVSPIRLIKQAEYSRPEVTRLFPPTLLIHGSADKSVPLTVAKEYGEALAAAGVKVRFRCYLGATHTDPIIEDPLRGCYHLTNDLAATIHTACRTAKDADAQQQAADSKDAHAQHGQRAGREQRRPAPASGKGGVGDEEEEREWESRMRAKYGAKFSHMRRLPSLAFEVNGEQLVNELSVNIGRRMNPF